MASGFLFARYGGTYSCTTPLASILIPTDHSSVTVLPRTDIEPALVRAAISDLLPKVPATLDVEEFTRELNDHYFAGANLTSFAGLIRTAVTQRQQAPPPVPPNTPVSKNGIRIQVAVTTSTQFLEYAMRLWVTSLHGWHQDFLVDGLDVPIYTFDSVPELSPLRKLVTPLKTLFEGEPVRKNNNLLLAALQDVHRKNPDNADWYLLAEDDSIIVRENLEHAIRTLHLDPHTESIHGRCVGTPGTAGGPPITFAVGGSGILISKALTAALVPHIDTCRRQFAHLTFGDERIGACLQVVMNRTSFDWCHMDQSHPFLHYDIVAAAKKHANDPGRNTLPIIALHEKNPTRIRLLQEWIQSQSVADKVTLAAIHQDSKLIAALEEAVSKA